MGYTEEENKQNTKRDKRIYFVLTVIVIVCLFFIVFSNESYRHPIAGSSYCINGKVFLEITTKGTTTLFDLDESCDQTRNY